MASIQPEALLLPSFREVAARAAWRSCVLPGLWEAPAAAGCRSNAYPQSRKTPGKARMMGMSKHTDERNIDETSSDACEPADLHAGDPPAAASALLLPPTPVLPVLPEQENLVTNAGAHGNDEPKDDLVVIEPPDQNRQTPVLPFLVVAFGASAGGLQAVRDILTPLPADTGMALVLISHLAPGHKSYMTEILSKSTSMPVLVMEDDQQPEPDHLYVLPPDFDATIQGGRFHLQTRPPGHAHHLPIDLFFRSLAADQKNYGIGVVLSGADSDGASGLKTIKGEGGIALVQAPESAQHSSMPLSSIAADHVDLVLPPAGIASELQRLARQFARPGVQQLELGSPSETGSNPAQDQYFARVLQLLRGVSGLEFRLYKEQTLLRRVARRMVLLRIDTLADYVR